MRRSIPLCAALVMFIPAALAIAAPAFSVIGGTDPNSLPGADSISAPTIASLDPAAPMGPNTVTVDLINFAFTPNPITINVGDTIHWVWQASNMSTTSVAGSAEVWDSGVHNTGFTFDHTFTKVGSFNYYDVIHGFDNGNGTASGESGTINVVAAPEPATLALIALCPALCLRRRRSLQGR